MSIDVMKQAEKQEPVAWRNAAIRLGEELSSVGPDDYYNMTAAQWLDWAMDQQPRGKDSLPAPPAAQRQWVGLTDEEMYLNCPNWLSQEQCKVWIQQIEAKLKEKNGWYRQHVTDGSPCWCEPEISYTNPETGASVIVHKEPQ